MIIIFTLILSGCIEDSNNTDENDGQTPDDTKETTYSTEPFLWKIGSENPSYLFGSIHLSNLTILTLPDVVLDALEESDVVYTEIMLDVDALMHSYALSKLENGTTLEDLLPDNVETKLKNYLATKNVNFQFFSPYKIWIAATQLFTLDNLNEIFLYPSLDQYIWNNGVKLEKSCLGLETVEEQFAIFDSLATEEQIQYLEDTIDDLIELELTNNNIVNLSIGAYLEGDLEILKELDESDLDLEDPLYAKLIQMIYTDRNVNMTKDITDLINNNPETQYFFTIGAGHYYGDEGLISLLEAEGFTITRVDFNECDSCDADEIMIENRCYDPYSS